LAATLLAIPVLVILLMVQMVIASRLPLLNGTADIVLLVLVAWALQERVKNAWIWALIGGLLVSFVSALPMLTPLIGYMLIVALVRMIQKRIWQSPILAMLVATTVGTLFYQSLSWLVLSFYGSRLPLGESLSMVILPSTLLNLLLSLPVYALVLDMASWVYPIEYDI
jgi:rod shape-determining protein MreD